VHEEWNCKDCNSKELENSQAGVLLENFWCKAIFGTQFALLRFLRGLVSSILSFNYKTKFRYKKSLFKNQVLVTYPTYSQTFLKRIFYFEGDLVEKMQSWYLLCSSDFFCGRTLLSKEILVKKLSCGFYCDCFQVSLIKYSSLKAKKH
jgi:hypothetical protein